MNHRSKTSFKGIFSQIWAVFLLMVFLNALLIEALHHHEPEKPCPGKHAQEQALSKQFSDATPKCKLCEVLKHQSHFYDLTVPVQAILPKNTPTTTIFVYILKHPDAYILSCANKGPPVIVA